MKQKYILPFLTILLLFNLSVRGQEDSSAFNIQHFQLKYSHANNILGKNYVVCKDGKWGMVSPMDSMILAIKYSDFRYRNKHYLFWDQNKVCHLVNEREDGLINSSYQDIIPSLDGSFYAVLKNGEKGAIDSLGTIIIPLSKEYEDILPLENTNLAVYKEKLSRKGALYDKQGKQLTPFSYSRFSSSSNRGFYTFKDTSNIYNIGVIDSLGKVIIPCEYENFRPIAIDGLFCMMSRGKQNNFVYSLFNRKGEKMRKKDFAEVMSIDDTYFAASEDRVKYALFVYSGTSIERKTDYLFSRNLTHSLGMFIDRDRETQKIVIRNEKFEDITPFTMQECLSSPCSSHLVYYQDSTYGIMDNSLKVSAQNTFQGLYPFGENTFLAIKADSTQQHFGIVDQKGKELIPIQHTKMIASSLQPDTYALEKDSSWIVVNQQGKQVGAKYDSLKLAVNYYVASQDGKFGLLDSKTGEVAYPFLFDSIEDNMLSHFITRIGEKYGLISLSFKTLNLATPIPCIYEKVKLDTGRTYKAYKDGVAHKISIF